MSIEGGRQERTYGELLSDINKLKKPSGYGSYKLMYEHYREQGYIPIKTEEWQFMKLKDFMTNQFPRSKQAVQLKYRKLKIGEVDTTIETHVQYFKKHFQDLWDYGKLGSYNPENFGRMKFVHEMIRVKKELEALKKENCRLMEENQYLKKKLSMKEEVEHTNVRLEEKCISFMAQNSNANQNVKEEGPNKDGKEVRINDEKDYSSKNLDLNIPLPPFNKIVEFDNEELNNDNHELNGENLYGLDHFEVMNDIEKDDEMEDFNADHQVDDDILDNFDEENDSYDN